MTRALRNPPAGSIGTLVLPVVLFIASLVACAVPARAEQSHCGSYVIRPGDALLQELLGLSNLPERVSDVENDERLGWPRPADRPCDGPSCSRGSDPRPATPTTTSIPPLEHWACLGLVSCDGDPIPFALAVPDRQAHLDRLPSRIFHPPRAA